MYNGHKMIVFFVYKHFVVVVGQVNLFASSLSASGLSVRCPVIKCGWSVVRMFSPSHTVKNDVSQIN